MVVATSSSYEVWAADVCRQVRDACGAVWVMEDAVVPTASTAAQSRDLSFGESGVHVANTYHVLLGRTDCPTELTIPARRAEWIEARY